VAVPFVDLVRDHGPLVPEFERVFRAVVTQGSFVLGPEVKLFEQEFAAWHGVEHAVAVQSGTAALMAALAALGVGSGDEVITAPNTFVATVEAIAALGATPVLVDVEPRTLTLDTERVAAALGPKVKAVIPVHLFGQMADLGVLEELLSARGVPFIEDACQAHGATLHERMAGSIGRAGCFSFYPAKNLGALGEGGAVLTRDAQIAERVRRFRNHGGIAKYEHLEFGLNARLDSMQAGFLRVKLPHLAGWNERRRAVAARYAEGLSGLPLTLPIELPGRRHVYHLYVVRTPKREELASWLKERGIATGVHYPEPIHRLPAFRDRVRVEGSLAVAERAAVEILSLPMFPSMTDSEVDEVIHGVRSYFRR
jgi:dTDP-4-amino-4,6-dideoxygalactose transaminase